MVGGVRGQGRLPALPETPCPVSMLRSTPLRDGVVALMAADTLPDFRHQGIHTALMQVRLAAAAEAGCELAMVHGSPGGLAFSWHIQA